MIGAVDYPTFLKSFHDTLAKDCTSEREQLAEVKHCPYVAPNLEDSFVFKNMRWRFTFGNGPQTEQMYKILQLFHSRAIISQQNGTETPINLHYAVAEELAAEEGVVYIPNGVNMPSLHSGVDAEMFDILILPCLKKTLAGLKLEVELPVGKPSTLNVCSTKQVRFSVYETVESKLKTIEIAAVIHPKDGFTKVTNTKQQLKQAASKGIHRRSPQELKIVQIWCRQHEEPIATDIQKTLNELKVK